MHLKRVFVKIMQNFVESAQLQLSSLAEIFKKDQEKLEASESKVQLGFVFSERFSKMDKDVMLDASGENLKQVQYASILAKIFCLMPLTNLRTLSDTKNPGGIKFSVKSWCFFGTAIGAILLNIVVPSYMSSGFEGMNMTFSEAYNTSGSSMDGFDVFPLPRRTDTLEELQDSIFMRILFQLSVGQVAGNYFLHITMVACRFPAFFRELQASSMR